MNAMPHSVIDFRGPRSMMHCAFALVLFIWGPTRAVVADESHKKLDPAVRFALEDATGPSTLRVIITAEAGKLDKVRTRVLGTGSTIVADHTFIGALTATVAKSKIGTLELDSVVTHISLDHMVRSTAAPPPPTPVKPIDAVMLATLGLVNPSVTGKGVGVAMVDSGLQPSSELPSYAFFDFTKTSTGPAYDDYGHGTHIAGLIRANKPAGGMVGVSPGVRLISVKVLDATGQGFTSTVLRALDILLKNQGSLGIDVVNLSLGHPITEPGADIRSCGPWMPSAAKA